MHSPPRPSRPEESDPHTILLVEDNAGDRYSMRRAFGPFRDIHIEEAVDGVEGLLRLRSCDHPLPDMVILDLNLPRVDGWEVLAEMKADADLRLIPVIVMSSSQAKQDIIRAYNLHCSSYIVKPMGSVARIAQVIYTYWISTIVVPTRIPKL